MCNSRLITLQFIFYVLNDAQISTHFRMVGSHFLVISAANGRPGRIIKINDNILYQVPIDSIQYYYIRLNVLF